MLIVGAKGFAKEILGVLDQLKHADKIAFYDDVNDNVPEFLFNKFPILRNEKQVKEFFAINGYDFTIGIGNPQLRLQLYLKFKELGGLYCSTISPQATIGHYDIEIGLGCNVLSNAIFSNSVKIGKGCVIYYNVTLTHDCILGDFVELSPNVTLLGHVEVGSGTQIGASATVLPKIKIGNNVIVGAGSVVTKDIPDNCLVYGVPARIINR